MTNASFAWAARCGLPPNHVRAQTAGLAVDFVRPYLTNIAPQWLTCCIEHLGIENWKLSI